MGWGVVYLSVRLYMYPWFIRSCIIFLENARGVLPGVYALKFPICCYSDRWIPLRSRNACHTAGGISAAGRFGYDHHLSLAAIRFHNNVIGEGECSERQNYARGEVYMKKATL